MIALQIITSLHLNPYLVLTLIPQINFHTPQLLSIVVKVKIVTIKYWLREYHLVGLMHLSLNIICEKMNITIKVKLLIIILHWLFFFYFLLALFFLLFNFVNVLLFLCLLLALPLSHHHLHEEVLSIGRLSW